MTQEWVGPPGQPAPGPAGLQVAGTTVCFHKKAAKTPLPDVFWSRFGMPPVQRLSLLPSLGLPSVLQGVRAASEHVLPPHFLPPLSSPRSPYPRRYSWVSLSAANRIRTLRLPPSHWFILVLMTLPLHPFCCRPTVCVCVCVLRGLDAAYLACSLVKVMWI